MVVPRLGIEGGFRVLTRLVGRPEEFQAPHAINLTLTGPATEPWGPSIIRLLRGLLRRRRALVTRSIINSESM